MKQFHLFASVCLLFIAFFNAQISIAQTSDKQDPESVFAKKVSQLALADSASLIESDLLQEGKKVLTSSNTLNEIGANVLNQGHYQESRSVFRMNAQLFPQSKALGQVLISIAELDENDSKLKLDYFFNQCFQCMPSSTYLRNLGLQLLRMSKPEKALIAFQLNTMLFPEEPTSWNDYANALLAGQQMEQAAFYYDKLLAMESSEEVKQSAKTSLALIERMQSGNAINREMVSKNGRSKLIGQLNAEAFEIADYQTWYQKGFEAYEPNQNDLSNFQEVSNDIKVKVFFGSWCGDSKREVPKFMKLAQAAGLTADQIELVAVNNALDQYKQSDTGEGNELAIFRVPTFIVYQDGKELGRIIEEPKESFEKDLTTIVSLSNYTPNYNGAMVLDNIIKEKGSRYIKKHTEELANQVKNQVTSRSELYSYALTKYANEEYELALSILKINAVLHPDYIGNPLRMGQVYLKLGKTDKAIEYLNIYLKQRPNAAMIRHMIWELQRKKS